MSRVRAMRRDACRLRQIPVKVAQGSPGLDSVGAPASGAGQGMRKRGTSKSASRAARRRAVRLAASASLGVFTAGGVAGAAGASGKAPAVVSHARGPGSGALQRPLPRYCIPFGGGCGWGQSYPGDTSSQYVTIFSASTAKYPNPIAGTKGPKDYYGFEALGCKDAQGAAKSVTFWSGFGGIWPIYEILDFGSQYDNGGVMGAVLPGQGFSGTTFLSDAQIVIDVENYVYGWSMCGPPADPMDLGIGTNNSGSLVNFWSGVDWAKNVVGPVNGMIADSYYAKLLGVSALGANDIESFANYSNPAHPQFATYADAGAWAYGFSVGSKAAYESDNLSKYIDYGSADSCPTSIWVSLTKGCTGGWTVGDYYNIAWGNGWALALPEIYDSPWAAQWKGISWAGRATVQGPIDFSGVLWSQVLGTSVASTNAAWNDLQNQYEGAYVDRPDRDPYPIGLNEVSWLAASCLPALSAATSTSPYPQCF
ncbi:MAG: hypothetical protein ACYDEY_00295 [Acidimicrobiales bacterium]